MRFSFFCLIAGFLVGSAFAQDAGGLKSAKDSAVETEARKGWFWYVDPKEEKQKPPAEKIIVETKPSPSVTKEKEVVIGIGRKIEEIFEDPCLKQDTWTASCGFIDPGNDFEFQAKQRDILLQQMSLRPDHPESVEAAQRYMKWVVSKASQAANMWYYNMIQKPELDPTVKSPISELGIALASRIGQASQVEYFKLMREQNGLLFYFSRNDCVYCHEQAPYSIRVARTMGLRLINVPLDGICIEGFAQEDCAQDVSQEQMSALDVQIVPTMYLHVPANTWLRLSSGMANDSTVIANAVNFFSAYRAALVQGLDNGDGIRPSVSYNPEFSGKPSGTAPAFAKDAPNAPSQEKIMEIMGMHKKLGAAVDSSNQASKIFAQERAGK